MVHRARSAASEVPSGSEADPAGGTAMGGPGPEAGPLPLSRPHAARHDAEGLRSSMFTMALPVRWSDQDINRHVNNARVVTLIEEARLAAVAYWLGQEGVPDPARPRVVVSLALDYLRPISHGPELTALVWVPQVGRSSYTVAYELRQQGHTTARARTVLVQLDPLTGASTPLAPNVRAVLEQIMSSGPEQGGTRV